MRFSLRLTSMRQNIHRVCFTLDSETFTVRRHADVECGGLELKKSRTGAHQSALLPSLSCCLFVFASAMYGIHERLLSCAAASSTQLFTPIKDFFSLLLVFFPRHPGINRPHTHFFSGVFEFPLKCVFLLHCPDHKYHNMPPDRDEIKIKVHITSPRTTCTETHSQGLREGEFRLQ